ncbi:hemicentin-1 [Plakobranchus ocellatus]|uniref:Hemicentin-1 n=1 Tax=Plakobranchus ocellatus TaxID=259542 RepID=A0AAV4DB19_9GAST|nr:hemicentin-1 [Plakobranchus ocellatus]
MEIMQPELTSVKPNDRSSFVELCITKLDECSEEQFSGNRAIFSWQPGILPEKKARFWQTYRCVFTRNLHICPVDGGWSKWSDWSRCKAECDEKSWQLRTRSCDNPRPAFRGDRCQGVGVENRTCVGACTNLADGLAEAKDYVRKMNDVYPRLAEMCVAKHCSYRQVQEAIKDNKKVSRYWSNLHCVKYNGACPVNGGWSSWGGWSGCSVKCGYGQKFRKRECNEPTPKNGGIYCQGRYFEYENCLAKTNCDPDEVYTDWSNFGPCSQTCGAYGVETAQRTCLNLDKCQKAGFKGTDMVITVPCYGGECPDRVSPATARQTLKYFWRPPDRLQSAFGGRHRYSRVFLAAAILTVESIWSRVILACYTGL